MICTVKTTLITSSIIFLVCSLALSCPAFHKPAPVDGYEIHADGGIIYNPLSRYAREQGLLEKYDCVKKSRKTVRLGDYTLKVAVPDNMTAYDIVPIDYTLQWSADDAEFPVAVEAVAFEDAARRGDRKLFDLALPGVMDLDVEYMGSITANARPDWKHYLTPDFSDKPGKYPPFERKPFVRSGVVEAGDIVWFKFKYTNTGNTILDPEGIGGWLFTPQLFQKSPEGKYVLVGTPYNEYYRDKEYLYPGESREIWVHFRLLGDNGTPQGFGLAPGDYIVKFNAAYRAYSEFNPWLNLWDGPVFYIYEQPVKVEAEARDAPVAEGNVARSDSPENDKITRWIHTHEEFMTAFDCHIERPEDGSSVSGTLHLQPAPWTEKVVIKLITTSPVDIATVVVPVDVESDSLEISYNPDHQVSIIKDGMRHPVVWSQSMADMRANVQLGPFPERHIYENLKEMMSCGINIVGYTSMPWLYDDMHKLEVNHQGDAWKYFLDCARKEGLLAEGWGSYPYERASIQQIYNWITGSNIEMDLYPSDGYHAVSQSDPDLPMANAAAWMYQLKRWGDLYYQMERGHVPIGIEDTRGWMRPDLNIRYPVGERTKGEFREWLREKYGTIEKTNEAWGTDFDSFAAIDPEKDQVKNIFGHIWEYTDRTRPFHDWNRAMEDFDIFRTQLRVKNYKDTFDIIHKDVPQAEFLLRTEGGNVIATGIDPVDPNPHMRHIYYSQRRCAIIAEELAKSDEIIFHSDYTTVPYTPAELSRLTKQAVEDGIIPVYFPQFDNMRDIAINVKYGTEYQVHYNLPEPRKGQIMHTLTAVYPWFVATYEAGGVPGILWEDYQCDGFATETQKREMRFFARKLSEALNTDEAKRLRAKDLKKPDDSWRDIILAKPSYEVE